MVLYGLDIGGTTLKAAAVTEDGEVVGTVTVPAGGQIPREDLLAAAVHGLERVAGDREADRVGLAFGGLLQPDGTMRRDSTNLPNLADVPLAALFEQALGAPCRIDHDARAAVRGEAWTGAARGARNAMALTLGTGIGAGLLLDGRIHAGAHGGAGEIGVWRLVEPPGEGVWKTVEEVAAPATLARRSQRAFSDVFADWRSGGDQTLDEVFELIGRSIANAHLLLDLEVVVIIGGVTGLGEPFREAIERAWLAACPPEFRQGLSIRLGGLGSYAGAIGAAALWLEESKK